MALALSLFALLATCYQLYLQRIHNEKSVKPLIQINLTDSNGLIYVHVQNNGLGPLIARKLIFTKNDQVSHDIENCITLNPRSYQHVAVNDAVKRVVPPGTYLEVFSKQFEISEGNTELADVRRELAALNLKVEGVDIYNNKIVVERNLNWFGRHSQE